MKNQPLKRHVFNFSPKENSGEGLTLCTEFFSNGGLIGINTGFGILILQSYCNSASINLSGISITAELLRQLANELDAAQIEAKNAVILATMSVHTTNPTKEQHNSESN